jgi:hypothetical protein
MKFWKLLLIPVSLSVVVAGCSGNYIRAKVADAIRDALPKNLGPAKEYRVEVQGPSNSMLGGKIAHVHIEGTGVQLDPRMTVDQMTVDIDDVQYDLRKHELKKVSNAILHAKLSEASINKYLHESRVTKKDVRVRLQAGHAVLDTEASVAGIAVPISVTGRVEIVDGVKISFAADSSSVAFTPIPAAIANRLLETVNPIYDLSKLSFPVVLDKVDIEDGYMAVSGRAQFPAKGN